jgi:hypothetical protein
MNLILLFIESQLFFKGFLLTFSAKLGGRTDRNGFLAAGFLNSI